MKFQVSIQDLEAALQTVSSSMLTSSTDLTGHFVFRKHLTLPDKIEVFTHSSLSQAVAPFEAEILRDGASFTISGTGLLTFLDVLKASQKDATLVFDYEASEAVTKVYNSAAPKNVYPFSTLDPAAYRWFDKTLAEAKPCGGLSAERLKEALSVAKGFISSDETGHPERTVTEFRNSTLWATTGLSMLMVDMPGMEAATMRIQVKQHLSQVLAFLTSSKGGTVELLESSERMFFLRRGDGAILGWTYYHRAFPNLARPKEVDDYWWTLNVKSLQQAVKAVLACADKKDEEKSFVTLSRPGNTGPLLITALTPSGRSTASWEVGVEDSGVASGVDMTELSTTFQLSKVTLLNMLSAFAGDVVKLGVNSNPKKGQGYVRATEVRGRDVSAQDTYLFVLAWRKK